MPECEQEAFRGFSDYRAVLIITDVSASAVHLLRRRTAMKAWQPLSEIAYASGFQDYNAFYQTFRRQFGASTGATECKHGSDRPE
jgi:AraC-like DNA-binding protein